MKALLICLLLILLTNCVSERYCRFSQEKKTGEMKATKHELKDLKKGIPLFVTIRGKVYRNTHRIQAYNK